MFDLEKKAELLLPSIAYGDAAGLPFETLSAEQIAEKYGRVDRLMTVASNPFFIGEHGPGTWSDDTQLSLAVAKALIRANGFDIKAMAETHIEAYDETMDMTTPSGRKTKRGWGRSTTQALERLKASVSPYESGEPNGAGNGILMKMAPLAVWHAAKEASEEERYRDYDALTTMTHDSDIARQTTRIHGEVLHNLILNNGFDDDVLKNPILPETSDGKGFYAPQTLVMAYSAFLKHDGRFKPAVYEAVNSGGDTDSIASIVAAMSILTEVQELPEDYIQIRELETLQVISWELAKVALKD